MTFSICETPGLVYQYLHVEYYVVICTVFHSIKDVFCLISSFSFIYLFFKLEYEKHQTTVDNLVNTKNIIYGYLRHLNNT